jgi:hypothetical protein
VPDNVVVCWVGREVLRQGFVHPSRNLRLFSTRRCRDRQLDSHLCQPPDRPWCCCLHSRCQSSQRAGPAFIIPDIRISNAAQDHRPVQSRDDICVSLPSSLSDARHLGHDVLVNATGLGPRDLADVQDKDMLFLKGQIMIVKSDYKKTMMRDDEIETDKTPPGQGLTSSPRQIVVEPSDKPTSWKLSQSTPTSQHQSTPSTNPHTPQHTSSFFQ